MWIKVKIISKTHPNPVIRQYAKHLLCRMNAGDRNVVEIRNLINNHFIQEPAATCRPNSKPTYR